MGTPVRRAAVGQQRAAGIIDVDDADAVAADDAAQAERKTGSASRIAIARRATGRGLHEPPAERIHRRPRFDHFAVERRATERIRHFSGAVTTT